MDTLSLTHNEACKPVCIKKYSIEVEGRIDEVWSDYFQGLAITYARGVTTLTGPIADRAALHGLLNMIRDLTQISVLRRSQGG